MYQFNKKNYKKYIASYYNRIIIIFLCISLGSYFIINTNFFGSIGTISLLFVLIALINKYLIKYECKYYDLNIFKKAITFSKRVTINNETQDTTFVSHYEILDISNYREKYTCFIIYGNIRKNTQVAFTDDMGKSKYVKKIRIYKGFSNVEEFKQELERIKNR